MAIRASSFEYGVIHFDTVLEAVDEMKDDPEWWNVLCGGIMWFVKRKKKSWGFVEGLLQKSSEKYRDEIDLDALYFVNQRVEPIEAFDRVIYKLCKDGDISTETNYDLCIHEVLSFDDFVERYQYV